MAEFLASLPGDTVAYQEINAAGRQLQVKSSFDLRESFKRKNAYKREGFCDSFHRNNLQRLARISCNRDLYACFSRSR
jgi:hypothetical protein